MSERSYSQSEVNRIFPHNSPKTLMSWALSGLVEWAGEHEDGRGIHREYELQHIRQLALVAEFMSLTTSVKLVKRWMNYVNSSMLKNSPELWSKNILIVNKVDHHTEEKYVAQLIPIKDLKTITIKDIIKLFGDPLLITIVDLRKIVDKVNYLVKEAGV
jgi:hypothetical protein